jgi:polyhydroxybutyrate depolymerase
MPRLERFLAIVVACSVAQAAFGASETMWHHGIRTYETLVPGGLPTEPGSCPLVISLHGTGADGITSIATMHLGTLAATEKFIVAAPDGLMYEHATFFNAGGPDYETLTGGTDDLGFLSRLIDRMILRYPVIDPTRVYLMGHSGGAMMAYYLAAMVPEKVAAIAVNSGAMTYTGLPVAPVPVIHTHGLEDGKVPWDGGTTAGVDYPATMTTINTWVGVNGCDPTPVTIHQSVALVENRFGIPVLSEILGQQWVDPTGNGNDVVLYTLSEGGHGWKNADDGLASTDEFWAFLSARSSEYAGPIPEPATMLLFGSGILGLLMIRRRRRGA